MQLILNRELKTVFALIHVCSESTERRKKLASSLLQVFRHERVEAHLLRTIAEQEIDAEQGAPLSLVALNAEWSPVKCCFRVDSAVVSRRFHGDGGDGSVHEDDCVQVRAERTGRTDPQDRREQAGLRGTRWCTEVCCVTD